MNNPILLRYSDLICKHGHLELTDNCEVCVEIKSLVNTLESALEDSKHWRLFFDTLADTVDIDDIPWIKGDLDNKRFIKTYVQGLQKNTKVGIK